MLIQLTAVRSAQARRRFGDTAMPPRQIPRRRGRPVPIRKIRDRSPDIPSPACLGNNVRGARAVPEMVRQGSNSGSYGRCPCPGSRAECCPSRTVPVFQRRWPQARNSRKIRSEAESPLRSSQLNRKKLECSLQRYQRVARAITHFCNQLKQTLEALVAVAPILRFSCRFARGETDAA